MSSSSSFAEETPVQTIFKNVMSSSSEEPPMEEWSSLVLHTPPDCPKKALYKEGLYDPGSGEICGKYITISDSTVIGHPYYAYPGVKDPGIMEALMDPEPKKIYDYDGQELYLELCKQMDVVPVRAFHRGLLGEVIDLKYYGVNPAGVRAMCLSLTNNRFVRRLDLTDNQLSNDAFYHLGQLLGGSFALQELVLSGCRLNVSCNKLSSAAALAFSEALEFNNNITHLDISWNKMYPLKGSNELLRILGESTVLTELNVSWNSLTTGVVLRKLLGVKTLQVLDLSNNRLSTAAVKAIAARLIAAKKLHTLDLSHNPISPADAFLLVSKMREKTVKLKNLLMDDVAVTKEFIVEYEDIMSYSYRRDTTITFGRVIQNYTLSQPDLREIVMKRLDFITARATKKCNMDIALYFLRVHKEGPYLQPRELMKALKIASAPVEEGLMDEVANCFPGPKTDKGGAQINLAGVVEYIKRLWPDKKLPPTPPPEPEPIEASKKKGETYVQQWTNTG